jgi:hypothetical protein
MQEDVSPFPHLQIRIARVRPRSTVRSGTHESDPAHAGSGDRRIVSIARERDASVTPMAGKSMPLAEHPSVRRSANRTHYIIALSQIHLPMTHTEFPETS